MSLGFGALKPVVLNSVYVSTLIFHNVKNGTLQIVNLFCSFWLYRSANTIYKGMKAFVVPRIILNCERYRRFVGSNIT